MNVAEEPAPRRHPVPRFTPPWLGGLQDLRREHGFEPLAVSGRLPDELRGTLYRNGPARFSVGGERTPHWFDGDGAITAVRLEGGAAQGAVKLVRTEGLEREERAGRRLFGGYGTPLVRPIRELFLRDGKQPANTSVLLWQGRLFATCEADAPYEMARGDLSTLGPSDLGGVVAAALSAHPHAVPARRATYGFGVTHGRRTRVDLYRLPDQGPPTREGSFTVDGVRLVHDFAVTQRHAAFLIAPHFLSIVDTVLRRKAPVASAAWRGEHGTEIVVVDLDAPSRQRRLRAEAFLVEHVVNAYEQGDEIVIDGACYDDADGLEGFVGGLTAGRIDAALGSSLRRIRLGPGAERVAVERLVDRPLELPRVSPRVDAAPHRYTYALEFEQPWGALVRVDGRSGDVAAYRPGADVYLGEGVFVPRPCGVAEDDGWVLTMAYDSRADQSRLEILDARALADGPLARCAFDQPIPLGFHGAFAQRE